jgi:endonuclease YncB( thermonuclease family)
MESVTVTSPSPASPQILEATVRQVFDADTIGVRLGDGRRVHVQLIGIDAPDGGTQHRADANAYARRLLTEGRGVFLERASQLWDDEGRLMAYFWLSRPGGNLRAKAKTQMLNAILLTKGWAHIEEEPPNLEYASLFRSLQDAARSAGRGIWG